MPSAVAAFRLLLLTGCRLSEIQFLRWEYVKDDCLELPVSKTGGRVVLLGPEARAVLAALPREEDNPWVIRRQAARAPTSPICRSPGDASVRAPDWRTCEFMTCAIPMLPEHWHSARASR